MKLPGTATQDENIFIAMGKLDIKFGNLFLDIGCGSGAVSLAASRFTDEIYGIDLRWAAIESSRSKVPGGKFMQGEASQILPMIPPVDRCFIGGTSEIDVYFPLLLKRVAPGCVIVANLARIGMASKMVELMKSAGIFRELLQTQFSHGYELVEDIALKPANPIFMVVGKC